VLNPTFGGDRLIYAGGVEQRIGFVDVPGGRMAYATAGEGPPLVIPTGWFTHLELDWQDRLHRPWHAFAAGCNAIARQSSCCARAP
jgi:hypothetical protein